MDKIQSSIYNFNVIFLINPLNIIFIIYLLVGVLFVVDIELLNKIYLKLIEKKYKIATAESCTGGFISHNLTNISGSSSYFDRGIVSYSNESKIDLLGVSREIIEKYGAVSEEVAIAMAEGLRKKFRVDIGLSTTGIAGPTGGTKEKPVGLVFIGISIEDKTIVKKFIFKGDRLKNKQLTCIEALNFLYDMLC
jgi:nicotinamide-nucleotide amidase